MRSAKTKQNKTKAYETLVDKDKNFTARILNPSDAQDKQLFEELRYKSWVKEYRFLNKAGNSSKREHDKYDEHSVHFGVFDNTNKLVGYSRLILPGKHGLQVETEFKSLFHTFSDYLKKLKRSVESSRLIAVQELEKDRHFVAQLIYKYQYQYAKKHGYRYWYQISEMKLIRAFKRRMYPFRIIGEGKDFQNGICYPAFMDLHEYDSNLIKKAPDYYRWINKGLDDTLYYDTLISRNTAFIERENIDKIKNTRIFFAGCGLGSMIALLCVRMGFTKFIVADFDKVELSNLNRQTFTIEDIGKNKAVSVADNLLKIQPDAEIEIIPDRLTPSTVYRLIRDSDIIVNTVDFNETCYAINDIAVTKGKPVFFPLNAGFGGFVLVFDKDTTTLREMTGGVYGNADFINNLAGSLRGYKLPDYLLNIANTLDDFEAQGYLPQTGIAVNISSSLVVLAIMGYISGWPIKLAPYPITTDAMFAINTDHSYERDDSNIVKQPGKKKRKETRPKKKNQKAPPLIIS